MNTPTTACPNRVTCRTLTGQRPAGHLTADVAFGQSPRLDGDPICPMTRTTNCDGADATKCPAC